MAIFSIGILTLRSVRDVLDRGDRRQSQLHDAVISDFDRHITDNRKLHPIYWEFICNERNNIVHEFSFEAKAYPVTRRPFLVDTTLTYDKLVAKYGEYRVIIWGDELEDGLRLADIGLTWWDTNLRIIEQAIRVGEKQPFSEQSRLRHELEEARYTYRPRSR